jgi:hypothetical protein
MQVEDKTPLLSVVAPNRRRPPELDRLWFFESNHVELSTSLVVRKSCAPPRTGGLSGR